MRTTTSVLFVFSFFATFVWADSLRATPGDSPDRAPTRAAVAFPFDVGDIPAGETLVLEFQASVPAVPVPAGVESVSNQATISGDGVANTPSDDPDTMVAGDATVTLVAAAPDLAVVKTVTDILDDGGASTGQTMVARPGNTVIYQLAWENTAAATQIAAGTLTDIVPPDTTFDAGASTAGWSCADGAPTGTPCTFNLGELAPGTSGTTTFAVDVREMGLSGVPLILNTASITIEPGDLNKANNMSTVQVSLVNEADIAVDIAVDQSMPIVGESAIFTLTATNNGPEQATNVALADNINTIATVNITGSMASTGMYNSGSGTWTIPSLGIGSSATVTVTVTALAAGGPTSATFSLSGLDQDDPTAANDSDAVDVEPKDADYGDAPDPLDATAGQYPTLLANDGARHALPNAGATLFLGAAIDADADGQPNVDATGDDTDTEGDDEDGVTFITAVRDLEIVVDVVASSAGLLDAWVDFDGDGVFARDEQVFTSEPVAVGPQTLTGPVIPMTAVDDTFARFRLSSAGGLLPAGRAADGEVEDYAIAIIDLPEITVADAAVVEGDPGDDVQLVFTITRSNNANDASVDVATRDGSALAGVDYEALTATTITFTAGGDLSQDVMVSVLEDNSVEGDENLFLDLSSPVDAVITDDEAEGIIENDDFDETPPTVDAIDVVDQGMLTECRTVLGDVSQLAITFSEAMDNADDPTQYRLVAAGPDGDLATTSCAAPTSPTDREIAVLTATSDGAMMPTLTLDLAGAPRSSDAYRLLVCGTLTDEAGNFLDGGAGAGSDLVRTFRVDRFNRFANGHFDDCDPTDVQPVIADGWTLTPGLVMTDREDADGAAISGSVVADLVTTESASAVQTVLVVPGDDLALQSRFRLDLMTGLGVRFGHQCTFFSTPDGTGPTVSAFNDVIELDLSTAGWLDRETIFTTPDAALSATCGVSVVGLEDGSNPSMFRMFFDGLTLTEELFSDGFESGDTSAWSSIVPDVPEAPPPPPRGDALQTSDPTATEYNEMSDRSTTGGES